MTDEETNRRVTEYLESIKSHGRKCYMCEYATIANHHGNCFCRLYNNMFSRSPEFAERCQQFKRAKEDKELCSKDKCKDSVCDEFCDSCRFEWLEVGMLHNNGELKMEEFDK